MIKKLFGVLLAIAGAALGAYVGLYLCFWGGIVDMGEAVLHTGDFLQFAWGFVKFWFSAVAGWGLFYIFAGISAFFFAD
jgi:hypothetical protein